MELREGHMRPNQEALRLERHLSGNFGTLKHTFAFGDFSEAGEGAPLPSKKRAR